MSEKYFFGKCGGHNCFYFSSRHFSTAVNLCMKDYEICDTARCKNCPHGITISEAADKMLRFSLIGKNFDYADLPAQRRQREEELEYLLEVQNGKKQN